MKTPAAGFLTDTLILDTMTDPIFIKDEKHIWIYANKAFCQILNQPSENVIGKTDTDFLPQDMCDAYWTEDDFVLQTGEESHKEEDIHEPGLASRRILTKKNRIMYDGKPYVFGMIRDITDLARVGRLSQLGEMAAGLSHELMTPLTVMDFHLKNYAERLIEGDPPAEDTLFFMANMEKAKDRLINIIKGVRAFAQSQNDLPMVKVRMNYIMDEAVELATPRLDQHRVKLHVDQIPDLKILCRGPQISQIMINLIHNAADAVAHHPDPWIKVHFELGKEWLELVVTDSGKGIPPEIVHKLMVPFFTTKPSSLGTGLGLSLASKIASEHGGSLYYDGKATNTCFRLRLPLTN